MSEPTGFAGTKGIESWVLILRGMAARPYAVDMDNILTARDCRTLRNAADEFERVAEQRKDLLAALQECQRTLAMLTSGGKASGLALATAYANCVAAEAKARAAIARATEREGRS